MAVNQSPGHIVCSASPMASLRSTKDPADVAWVGPWTSLPGKNKTDRMACVAAKLVPTRLLPSKGS